MSKNESLNSFLSKDPGELQGRLDHNDLRETAKQYIQNGISVIPICLDGTKKPAVSSWKPYQAKYMTTEEVEKHFLNKKGIAIVCGAVSQNIEIIDFDEPDLFPKWQELVENEVPGLLGLLPLVNSPSGGWHIYYRCKEISSNQKLAQSIELKVLIETRGEGGYIIAPESSKLCHPDSKPYRLIKGSLYDIPEIEVSEREILLRIARSFNQNVKVDKEWQAKEKSVLGSERPGDKYNNTACWEDILTPHDWKRIAERGGITYWQKPRSNNRGHHATTGAVGDYFFVFSTSAPPFEPGHAYSKFTTYTLLNHQGDFKAAARELSAQDRKSNLFREGKPITPNISNAQNFFPTQNEQTVSFHERNLKFKPYSFNDLFKLPRKEYLVENVFGRQDLGIIFGLPEAVKTAISIDLSVCCCKGFLWANRFKINRPLNIAYCTGEGYGGLPSRFRAAAKCHNVDSIENFTFFDEVPQLFITDNIRLFIEEWKIRQQNGVIGPLDLLIIDTLHLATIGANENSSQDMGVVIQNCRLITHELGCAILLIHHTTKDGTSERGSLALRASADFMIEVRKNARNCVISCSKLKDGAHWPNIFFQLCAPPGSESICVNWNDHESQSSVTKTDIERLLEIIASQSEMCFTVKSLAEKMQILENYTRNLLYRLIKQKRCDRRLSDPQKKRSKNNVYLYFAIKV